MSAKGWLSTITLVFITALLIASRHQLYHAWRLLENVNLWVLALVIPTQLLLYFSGGQIIFSYLREKRTMPKRSGWLLARISLELNFVNHVLPSGGVSGFSYMNWRLGKLGVSQGRAAMAQVVRYAVGAMAFLALLIVAVVVVTIDGNINRWIILVSSTLVSAMVAIIVGAIYLVGNLRRMERFANWLSAFINHIVRRVTLGRRQQLLHASMLFEAFEQMHHDYLELRRDKRILIRPFLWALGFTLLDVTMFLLTFWALGAVVNPAPILIAYGVATMAGFIVITPGGAGAYEAIMVAFLAIAGVHQGVAIAGIVLTRVIELVTTIGLGYVFYQRALPKGSHHDTPS